MSLRLRLTLLYSALLGGVMLIFSALVYGLVSVILLEQVDSSLVASAEQIIPRLQTNQVNQFDLRKLASYQPTDNLYFQVWGTDWHLQISRPAGFNRPLDEIGRSANRLILRSVSYDGLRMRVLSVPLRTARGPVGVLQVGTNLALIDIAQSTLASVLVILTLAWTLIAAMATWLITNEALAPLATVTRIATQITRADDLQRRIPEEGAMDDEVGELIRAFNQTLERLEKLFTTQRRFIADVSHELRTPLTVIKGNVGLIRRLKQVDEESLAGIEAEVDRLSRLVGDLLLLAQAESGRLPLDRSPVELDTVLLEVYQQMRLLAGERLQVRLVEIDQVQVLGDRDRLKQVLLNLVGNAVQYTQPGGQVTLALRKSNQKAQLLISDNGPGIPAEDLPHIFERFYRGEKSRRRSAGSGFGLGLSIAYWIVRSHDGTIDVSSQEGKGTVFSVWLPLLQPETTTN